MSYQSITQCRVCNASELIEIISLGKQPPANSFLNEAEFASESKYPLALVRCALCKHVQLRETVNPEELFRNYKYVSSTSPSFVKHFQDFADQIVQDHAIAPGSLVVDIGSNDGILLRPFKDKGCQVVGVDPAADIAALATLSGIPTVCDFFTWEIAQRIVRDIGKAQLVTATNMFAHTEELYPILHAVKELLAPNGVFIIEVPYLKQMLHAGLFDTIYHEHISYWSVSALYALGFRAGFKILKVQKVPTHGGSLRVTFKPDESPLIVDADVEAILHEEEHEWLHSSATYSRFKDQAFQRKDRVTEFVKEEIAHGKIFAAYGAPAKGNTALNFYGFTNKDIRFIVDDSPNKQNLYAPGSHIPVVSLSYLLNLPAEERPHYMAVLAWNYFEEIQAKLVKAGFNTTCIAL